MRPATKQIFLEVCDLEPEARRKRLVELCSNNRELLQEVERLLLYDYPGSMFESSASASAPSAAEGSPFILTADQMAGPWTGRTIQGYRLLEPLGKGGMGEVYRAEDTRLKRVVAVKFLAPRFLRDERQKRRFLREAQAAAALDHPFICPVYDVGESDGQPYIVSAFIEGQNLADVIQLGDRPVLTTLDYLIQIAEGLQAAHSRGVVHRDMKPGNVILTGVEEGRPQVKIIDFGLAWIIGSTHLTEQGGVIGTAAYIAPEILEGQEIDQRVDIWSLGVMLYEMLAGSRPFDADNRERLFYMICREEAAPLTAVRPNLPEDAARIVAKALQRDRNLRYQNASEICSDLRRLKRDLESNTAVIVPGTADEPAMAPVGSIASVAKAEPTSDRGGTAAVSAQQAEASARRPWNIVGVVGAVALAGIFVVFGWYTQEQTARQPDLSRRQLTSNSSEAPVNAAAISPDGKYLAYADDTGIYVRVIETAEKHLLSTVVSGFATSKLSWFPDGIRLVASGTAAGETVPSIWALSILRGAPLKLRADARGASVSPNGSQIAFLNGNATEIWLMGGNGEEPQRFVAADEGYFLLALAWFPDSERLGYLRRGHGERRSDVSILSRDLKESQSVAVFADPKLVAFCILSDGRLLVSRGVDSYTELNKARGDSAVRPLSFELWEIGTNPRTGQASGSPRRVSNWTGPPLTDLSATADGKRLAYLEGPAQYDVYTAELEGNGLRLKPPRRLTLDDSLDIPSAWTPDGKEILFHSDRDGTFDIFKQAIDQRTAEAIVAGPRDECDPTVSSDGAWILYFDDPIHRRNVSTEPVTLRRVPFSGGPSQVVLKEPGLYLIDCTGSKAKAKLCVMDKRVGGELIFYAFDPVQGMGRELTRIHDPNIRHFWRLSPDGSNIAMPTRERGGGIRIFSLTGKPARSIFVNEPIDHVLWSADGRGFYATTVDTNVVPWAAASGSFQKLLYVDLDGHTHPLWQSANFSGVYGLPSPDGRYLALGMGRMIANAWLVENF